MPTAHGPALCYPPSPPAAGAGPPRLFLQPSQLPHNPPPHPHRRAASATLRAALQHPALNCCSFESPRGHPVHLTNSPHHPPPGMQPGAAGGIYRLEQQWVGVGGQPQGQLQLSGPVHTGTEWAAFAAARLRAALPAWPPPHSPPRLGEAGQPAGLPCNSPITRGNWLGVQERVWQRLACVGLACVPALVVNSPCPPHHYDCKLDLHGLP